jgi:hypothetical protein
MLSLGKFDQERAFKALRACLELQPPASSLEVHEIVEVIKALQETSNVDEDQMIATEWAYLPLLEDYPRVQPQTLERRLARDPEFFCYVISTVFRSHKTDRPTVDEKPPAGVAENGYRLLRLWRTPPGLGRDGLIVAAELESWIAVVRDRSGETGHLEIAMETAGHVLAYSPADPDSLWISRPVAGVLNGRNAKALRSGFVVEVLNQRGAHFVDPSGQQERGLATKFRRQAGDVDRAGFSRLAAALRQIAQSYEAEAKSVASRHGLED